MSLEDADIVEAEPASVSEAPARKSSTPPPPPSSRRSSTPPPPQSTERPIVRARAGSVPFIDDDAWGVPVEPTLRDELPMAQGVPTPLVQLAVPPAAVPPAEERARPVAHHPPSEGRTVARGSAPDPTDVLFDGIYELNFAASVWQAASLCATALGRALGARAVVVHAHDLVRRELRAIGVHGTTALDVLGSAEPAEDDLVASAAICNESPVTMRFDGELPRLAPRRLTIVGTPRTVVAIPAMAWGRCLAVIEIIDADERFASRVADCGVYAAERLAEFFSTRAAA